MSSKTVYDYVVVGAGVAGLTLASRLSKLLPAVSILIVEAGTDPTVNPNILVPAGYQKLQPSEQAYEIPVAPNPHLDNRSTTAYVGKALSGSAAINAGAWTRGPASDYNLWAELTGDDGWSYNSMLPYFKLTERDTNSTASSGQHGQEGTITATAIISKHSECSYPLRDTVKQAFAEAGIPYNSDMNNGKPNGLSENIEAWLNGIRQLPHQLLDLSRVTIWDNCTAKRITFSASLSAEPQATGIELLDGTVITARREVILSAGTYHTPKLLMLSGIGPTDQLRSHGIQTRLHQPHVGANLADHLALAMTLRLRPELAEKGVALMHPSFLSNPSFLTGNPLDFIHFNTLSTPEQQSALRRLNEADERATALLCRSDTTHIESITSYIAFPESISGIPDLTPLESAKGDLITVIAMALATTSLGSVTLRSADPLDHPYITSNQFSTPSDRYVLREAIRTAMRPWTDTPTGKATVLEEVVAPGFEPILPTTSDEAVDARIRKWGYTLAHPMGTCRMATGAADGVVDSQCRVFGTKGLRVVDASVLPVPMAAHLQAVVYALAERAAVIVAEGQH